MRVSHVITRLIVGGAQENTVDTVLGLEKKPGVEVELISGPTNPAEGSLADRFQNRDCRLQIVSSLVRPVRPWTDLRATRELARHFRKTQPDIVHTHSGKAGFVGRLAARMAGVRCIVHTIHGPSFGTFQGAGANLVYKTAERMVGPLTTHFISVAQSMTNQYLAAGIAVPQKYTRIFSGFSLAPFLAVKPDAEKRRALGIDDNDFVIAKLARLVELKGHDDLLDAAPEIVRAIPTARFLLIGDGPLRERLELRAAECGLRDRFLFVGLVPPAQVPEYFCASDALVHLSYREGLPRAVSQASAAALPVVAYDCDGAPEICLDGRTGYLGAPKDSAALVDRLKKLSSDVALRRMFGEAGREFVRQHFGVEKMVDDIFGLYQKLLARG